jgi:hypothetical protein
MVICSCRKTGSSDDENSSSHKSKSSKKTRFSFFRRKQPLVFISTDLDEEDSPTYSPAELQQLKSTKKSKSYVDAVLYRNRNSGRRTLLSRDGVPLFTGFLDWFNRKRLREKKEKGERYIRVKENGNDVRATTMMLKAQRIDPLKSGFMGKKADRDGTMGCAVGKMAAAHWAEQKARPLEKKLDIPQNGCGGIIGCGMPECYPVCGADDSFATAATACSPWSNGSVSFHEEDCSADIVANTKQRVSFQECQEESTPFFGNITKRLESISHQTSSPEMDTKCQEESTPFFGNITKRLESISHQTSSPEMDTKCQEESTPFFGNIAKRLESISHQTSSPEMDTKEDFSTRYEGNNAADSYSETLLLKNDITSTSTKKKIRVSKNVECLF